MPTILKPIAAILLAVPLLAQSPIVARRINPHPDFMPRRIERMASAYILHVGERSEPLRASLQALLVSQELAEMNIKFESVAENAPLYSQLAKEIGLKLGSKWALTDADGRLVAQGTEAPKAAELRKAMDAAGVKSPVQRLREFLKANPDNLDARLDLLDILKETAEAGTKKALRLNILTPAEAKQRARDASDFGASSRTNSLIFDLVPLEGKELDSAEDAKIWGPYAAELDALFTNSGWRILKLPDDLKLPLEAASPRMAQLYRRHLPKIESALEEEPSKEDLWRVYSLAHAVAKRGSVRTLMDRLAPAPNQEKSWPADNVFDLLMSEERAKGNWGGVALELWSRWPALKNTAREKVEDWRDLNAGIRADANIPESTKESINNAMVASLTAPILKNGLVPLVEALIKAGRALDAETVLTDIARLPDYRGFQRMAAEVALQCGREDLSQKWLALEIPIKDKADKDDLDLTLKLYNDYMPVLAVANGEQHEAQVSDVVQHDSLLDWGLHRIFLNPEQSELMNRSYGLPDKDTNWLLVDANGKTIQYGSGLPTPGALAQALINSATPTRAEILRRFVLAHPSHYQAKSTFLYELRRLAEQKTKDKLGEGAGKDKTLVLSEKDDEAIWGEYASVFAQILSHRLEQSMSDDISTAAISFTVLHFHSPKMKALAAQCLPRVEDALKRQPLSYDWWEHWFVLCPFTEKANFKIIRESLAIPPTRHQQESPSIYTLWYTFLWFSMNGYPIDAADWQMVANVYSWVLEGWRPIFEADPAEMGKNRWDSIGKPLMEAYLRLDKDSEANALATWCSTLPNWSQIKPNMVDLAKKCGKPELAEKWGRM